MMSIDILVEDVDETDLNEEGFEVANLIATIDLNQELYLKELAKDLSGSKYRPESFPFIVYRPEGANATVLIPTNGNVSITGAKSKRELVETAEDLLSTLSNLGITSNTGTGCLELQNVVITGDLDLELDLAAVTIELGIESCEYEPEQFPAVFYRKQHSPLALLFNSGKVVITGAESYVQALDTGRKVADEILESFGKD